MAFTFDAGPLSATMNSYASVEFADDYFSGSFRAGPTWAELDDTQKQAALVQASNFLDTFIYGGLKTSRTQPMQWPRSGMYDNEGNAYSSQVLPTKVLQATCEMAFWYVNEGNRVLDDVTVSQYEGFKAGPLDVKIRKGAATMPPEVLQLLNAVGLGTVISTGDNGSAKTMNMSL